MREAAAVAWRTPTIRWAIAVAMLAVTASHVYFYLQQPYLEAVGVPLALFGVVFAATKALTALVSASAHRIDAALGQRRAVALMTEQYSGRSFLGGSSYGVRQSSLLVAAQPGLVDGLLLLSYPLHPPGKPERPRTERHAHADLRRSPRDHERHHAVDSDPGEQQSENAEGDAQSGQHPILEDGPVDPLA